MSDLSSIRRSFLSSDNHSGFVKEPCVTEIDFIRRDRSVLLMVEAALFAVLVLNLVLLIFPFGCAHSIKHQLDSDCSDRYWRAEHVPKVYLPYYDTSIPKKTVRSYDETFDDVAQ